MNRININSCIENITEKTKEYEKCEGIIENNKISYKYNDINVTILLSGNRINMVRESQEYTLEIIFDDKSITKGIYDINNLGKFDVEIETKKLDIIDKNIYIEYVLKMNAILVGEFKFNLDYEVI